MCGLTFSSWHHRRNHYVIVEHCKVDSIRSHAVKKEPLGFLAFGDEVVCTKSGPRVETSMVRRCSARAKLLDRFKDVQLEGHTVRSCALSDV